MPTISVVVPVYKTENYLEKCINSLLCQTYSDFEIILVDDGSPDDSGELCDEFSRYHANIKTIHKENGGLTSAREAGFVKAKGDYIAFVDSDDYVHPRYLEQLINAIIIYNADLSICGYTLVKDGCESVMNLPWQKNTLEKEEIYNEYSLPLIGRIRDNSHINLNGFMWLRLFKKNSLSHEFFVSEREVFTEDDIFNLLYSDYISRIAIVDEPLYYYVQHPESLSNRYRSDKWIMLQKRYDFCKVWLSNHNLTQVGEDRLAAAAMSAVYACVDNATALNYRCFKQELITIGGSELYTELSRKLEIDDGFLNKGQKVLYFLLKNRFWLFLYLYRKKRCDT